jgi:hypothetical protein
VPVNRCHPNEAQMMVGVWGFRAQPSGQIKLAFLSFVDDVPEVENTKKGCQTKRVLRVVRAVRGFELK